MKRKGAILITPLLICPSIARPADMAWMQKSRQNLKVADQKLESAFAQLLGDKAK